MELVECKNFTLFTVVNSLEVDAAANGPIHGISSDTKLVFELLHEVVGTACLTVKLIDKGEYRDVSHCANLKQLPCLRLDTLCRIDYHYG